MDSAFAQTVYADGVLFYLPVPNAWLQQGVLALPLICHRSYPGVQEFIPDVLGVSIRLRGVHVRQTLSQDNSTADCSHTRQEGGPLAGRGISAMR